MADYKTIHGTTVKNYTNDPDNPIEGQVWFDETAYALQYQIPNVTAAGTHFGQYLNIDGDESKDNHQLIMKYRGIAMHPEVDMAIEDIPDDFDWYNDDIVFDDTYTWEEDYIILDERGSRYTMTEFLDKVEKLKIKRA